MAAFARQNYCIINELDSTDFEASSKVNTCAPAAFRVVIPSPSTSLRLARIDETRHSNIYILQPQDQQKGGIPTTFYSVLQQHNIIFPNTLAQLIFRQVITMFPYLRSISTKAQQIQVFFIENPFIGYLYTKLLKRSGY